VRITAGYARADIVEIVLHLNIDSVLKLPRKTDIPMGSNYLHEV
jgi:hypothetical protein